MAGTVKDNDRPRTVEQLAALPVGPEFGTEEHVYTEEDRRNGYITIRGKRINVVVGCSKVMIPVAPDVVSFWSEDTDIISWSDADGAWSLGRYADGRWFRRRS